MRKRSTIFALGLLPVMTFFQACSQPVEAVSDPTDEIRRIWAGFVSNWEAGDARACAAVYAENAINIPPGFGVNQGRQAIGDFYEFLFAANPGRRYSHTVHSVSYSGNMAVELGEFRADWITADGEEWTYHARSLTHWEKDASGKWKIRSLLFNQPPESS